MQAKILVMLKMEYFSRKTFYSLSIVLFIASNLLRVPTDLQWSNSSSYDLNHNGFDSFVTWHLTKKILQKTLSKANLHLFKYVPLKMFDSIETKNSCKRCFLHPCRLNKSKRCSRHVIRHQLSVT